jgi:imidazolonepropionase-like amidohydrolase
VPFRLTELTREPLRLDAAANFRLFSSDDAAFVLQNAKQEIAGAGLNNVRQFAPTMANKLTQLRSLGVPVAVGSDAGSSLHFQSNAIWWELEAWRAAGVSHRDVLIAATEHGAQVLRMKDIGHLRPGARADFVLYRGNVEEGPFDVGRVLAVAKGGVLVTAGPSSP